VRASRNVTFAEPVDERVRDRITAVGEGLEAVELLGLDWLACLVLAGQCLTGKIGEYRTCAAVFSARSFLDGEPGCRARAVRRCAPWADPRIDLNGPR
jgi:hypothetical protein